MYATVERLATMVATRNLFPTLTLRLLRYQLIPPLGLRMIRGCCPQSSQESPQVQAGPPKGTRIAARLAGRY